MGFQGGFKWGSKGGEAGPHRVSVRVPRGIPGRVPGWDNHHDVLEHHLDAPDVGHIMPAVIGLHLPSNGQDAELSNSKIKFFPCAHVVGWLIYNVTINYVEVFTSHHHHQSLPIKRMPFRLDQYQPTEILTQLQEGG